MKFDALFPAAQTKAGRSKSGRRGGRSRSRKRSGRRGGRSRSGRSRS